MSSSSDKRSKASRSSNRKSQASKRKSGGANLALSPWARRLRALEKRRQLLQERIERACSELAECEREQREFVHRVAATAMPILERCRAIDSEIHQLFAEIFQTRKFGERSRRRIVRIYESLQLDGVISDRLSGELPDWLGGFDVDDTQPFDGDDWESPPREPDWATAEPQPERKLRDIFLRLASSFHPDFARDEATRAHHTEVMKEVNRAYRERDAASLLAFEQELDDASHGNRRVGAPGDAANNAANNEGEDAAAYERLEGHVTLLHEQLSDLERRVDEARHSELGRLITDIREFGLGCGLSPSDLLLGEFREQLDDLEELRDFVHRFRHREMTIKAFIRGPVLVGEDDLFERLRAEIGDILHHTPDGW